MYDHLPRSWHPVFEIETQKTYFKNLLSFLNEEEKTHIIYPPKNLWFHAFERCCFNKLSIVIIGQDPYHNQNQANGLAFSVNDTVKLPPSLRNIFKELSDDIGCQMPVSGNLTHWANQGVLLLNSCLTVRAHQAASHSQKGWEIFTDTIIHTISNHKKNCVFLLWGKYAHNKEHLINTEEHLILKAPPPSPLSAYRGFFGSTPFSKINDYLAHNMKQKIKWAL